MASLKRGIAERHRDRSVVLTIAVLKLFWKKKKTQREQIVSLKSKEQPLW